MWTWQSKITDLTPCTLISPPLRFVDHFVVYPRYIAKVLCRLEHVACLIVIAAHADRTIIPVFTMNALCEILSSNGANAQCLGRFRPNPIQIMLMATSEINTSKRRTRVIIAGSIKTYT
jgi:hypothetical protein